MSLLNMLAPNLRTKVFGQNGSLKTILKKSIQMHASFVGFKMGPGLECLQKLVTEWWIQAQPVLM